MSNHSFSSNTLWFFFLAICVIFPPFIMMTLIGSGMNSSEGWHFQNSLLLECRWYFCRVDTYTFLCMTSKTRHRIFHHSLPGINQRLQERPIQDNSFVTDFWIKIIRFTLWSDNIEGWKEKSIGWKFFKHVFTSLIWNPWIWYAIKNKEKVNDENGHKPVLQDQMLSVHNVNVVM